MFMRLLKEFVVGQQRLFVERQKKIFGSLALCWAQSRWRVSGLFTQASTNLVKGIACHVCVIEQAKGGNSAVGDAIGMDKINQSTPGHVRDSRVIASVGKITTQRGGIT